MKAQFSSHSGFTTPAITDNRMWWERDPITASFIEIAKKQSEKYEVLNVDK
jgi:hypothetical protein